MITKIPRWGLAELKHWLKGTGGRFDQVIDKVKIISAANGSCTVEMKVEKEHTNLMGGLHGGFTSTLVDCVTGWAFLTHEIGAIPSVSVDLHISFLKGAKIGDELEITATTQKAAKSLGFLVAEIKNKQSGDLLVRATHTKSLIHGFKIND